MEINRWLEIKISLCKQCQFVHFFFFRSSVEYYRNSCSLVYFPFKYLIQKEGGRKTDTTAADRR